MSLVPISDRLNERPGRVFLQQKDLEQAWKQASASINSLEQQLSLWLTMFRGLMDQFKELGAIQTWTESMERQLMVIAHVMNDKNNE